MNKLSGDEIFKQLTDPQYNWYWGKHNDQPSVYLVTAILEQLPIEGIAGGKDFLQVLFCDELNTLQEFVLMMLRPDGVRQDRESMLINLWWD